MLEANVSKFLWTKGVNTTTYLYNCSPTRSNLGITLEVSYSRKKPDLSHLHIFGCIAFVHIVKQDKNKLEPKSCEGVLVGYGEVNKGYHCFIPQKRKMLVSRDVRVDEQSFMNQHYSSWTVQKYETSIFDPCEITTSQPRFEPYMQSYKEPMASDLIDTSTTIPTSSTKSDSEVQPSSSTHVSVPSFPQSPLLQPLEPPLSSLSQQPSSSKKFESPNSLPLTECLPQKSRRNVRFLMKDYVQTIKWIVNLTLSWPTDLYALHLEELDCPTSIEPSSFAEVVTDPKWCQVM